MLTSLWALEWKAHTILLEHPGSFLSQNCVCSCKSKTDFPLEWDIPVYTKWEFSLFLTPGEWSLQNFQPSPTHCYWTHTTSPPQWLLWKRRDSLQGLCSPGQTESPQFLQRDLSFFLLLLPPAAATPWPPSHTPSCRGLSCPKGWPSSPPSCGTGTRAIKAVSRTRHFLLACSSSHLLLLLTLHSLSLWNGTWIQLPGTHTKRRHWMDTEGGRNFKEL